MKVECNEASLGGVLIAIPKGYKHEVIQVTEENKWGLMARVRPLHEKLGWEPSRTEKEVYFHLREGTEVSLITALGSTPEDVAFVIQNMVGLDVNGKQKREVLSIAAKVIAPEYQRHQFGTFLAQEAILRHKPAIVTGRTANPNAMRAYEKTNLIEVLLPIDRLYTERLQIDLAVFYGELSHMLGRNVYEDDSINLRTGLCKGVYPPGASELFVVEELGPGARRIYDRMVGPEIGAKLKKDGNDDMIDGVRYWAVVNGKILSHFPYPRSDTELVAA